MAELVTQRVELDGAACDVLRAGDGDELIVFLHAVGGDRTSWRAQLLAAPPRYTAVALDFRGHGGAPRPPLATISVEQFARDVACLVDRMGFGSAHFVGLSMGGVVAQIVHQLRPELVATLTLASTWAHYGETEAKARNAYITDRLGRLSMMDGSKADMVHLLAPGTAAEIVEEAARVEGSKDPEIFLTSWLSMFAVDLRADLARVTAPTLLLGAPHDPVTPADPHLYAIARALPTARLTMLAGAGHFANLDHPDAFNRELYAFLRANPAPMGRVAGTPPPTHAIAADTTAHALVRLLSERGVDVLFANSGTDYVDVIDALARYENDPDFRLRVVAAPHENTMIAMAHGYYLATGRTQAVMGHVNVGSANMMLGIINASRSRIPILVMAGRTPHYDDGMPGCRVNFVQWGQDTFDQASFREFLKWDYELKSAHNLEVVVDRALAIAESDPAGPVYLTLPGEVLASPLPSGDGRFELASQPRQRAARAGIAEARAIDAAARAIARAETPLVITAELGRYRGGPAALARLAEQAAMPVIEFGKHNFMNFPTSHPMHGGFDPVPAVRTADLVIAVECHVPWIPLFAKLEKPPAVISVGVDPLAASIPMRAFPADIALAGDPAATLLAIADALRESHGVSERRVRIARAHDELFDRARRDADADGSLPRITKRFLSRTLGKIVDHDVLIFNEYDLDPTLVPRDEPGGWFENSIASGLGWALGAALGAKLAMPERTIVATVGDGSYLFNVPLSAHYVAAAERLPILVVIYNDQGWSTIKRSYRGARPQGFAAKSGRYPLCDFDVAIDFEKVAESCGGIGLRASAPSELEAVLREGMRLVRSGDRHVLVNVLCEKDDR